MTGFSSSSLVRPRRVVTFLVKESGGVSKDFDLNQGVTSLKRTSLSGLLFLDRVFTVNNLNIHPGRDKKTYVSTRTVCLRSSLRTKTV